MKAFLQNEVKKRDVKVWCNKDGWPHYFASCCASVQHTINGQMCKKQTVCKRLSEHQAVVTLASDNHVIIWSK